MSGDTKIRILLADDHMLMRMGFSALFTTVKEHLSAIFEQLGVANRAEAVALALRKQMLKP